MKNWNADFEGNSAWIKLAELERELQRIKPFVAQSTDTISLHTRVFEFAKRVGELKVKLNQGTTSAAYLSKISNDLEQLISTLRGKEQLEIGSALNNAVATLNSLQLDTCFYVVSSESHAAAANSNLELASNLLHDFKASLAQAEGNLVLLTEDVGKWQNEITDAKINISKELSGYKEIETNKVSLVIESLQKSAEKTLEQIESKLREAEKLVTIISNHGVIGGYQNVANSERNAKWFWQAITVGTLFGLIVYAVNHLASTPDWQTLIPRALIAGSFIALASYGGIQAEKHRKAEQKNRRLELGLAAVDPFLANLAPSDRDKLKQDLVSSLFEKEAEDDKAVNSVTSLNFELLVKLKDLFK